MPLPKGMTNNPAGRPPGTPNKTTAEIKGVLTQFINRNIGKMQEDFESIEDPCVRLYFMERLLKYIIPTRITSIDDQEDKRAENAEFLKNLADAINKLHKDEDDDQVL
jgi:hypothetical protein